jgi:hypothetical protein
MNIGTLILFLGASPQTPWVGFAELWVMLDLLEAYSFRVKSGCVDSGETRAGQVEVRRTVESSNIDRVGVKYNGG